MALIDADLCKLRNLVDIRRDLRQENFQPFLEVAHLLVIDPDGGIIKGPDK